MASAVTADDQCAAVLHHIVDVVDLAYAAEIFFRDLTNLDRDGLAVPETRLEFGGGPLCYLSAVIDDHDPGAELLDLFHVVGGVNDGGTLFVETPDALEDGIAALRVNSHRRLVEDNKLRMMRDAAGDVQTPEQAAGELFRTVFPVITEPGEVDRLFHIFFSQGFVADVEPAEKINVLVHGERIDHGHILHDDADFPFDVVC